MRQYAGFGTAVESNNRYKQLLAAGTTGRLIYELGATNASDRIAVAGTLTIGTAALGFSDFVFTNVGGLQSGTYKLITTSVGISGTASA